MGLRDLMAMTRRSLAALLPAWAATWVASKAWASDPRFINIPTDPRGRLVRRKWMFERLSGCRHSWDIHILDCRPDGTPFAYSYAGDGPATPPNIFEGTYQFVQVRGIGTTAIEAIDDWYGKLPSGQFETIIWRAKPEMASDLDFNTKTTRWQVYSRMALIPRGRAFT